MKKLIRRKFEAALVRLAARILMGRNVQRCTVASRRDNNDMWSMAEKLDMVALRMSSGYTKGTEDC